MSTCSLIEIYELQFKIKNNNRKHVKRNDKTERSAKTAQETELKLKINTHTHDIYYFSFHNSISKTLHITQRQEILGDLK